MYITRVYSPRYCALWKYFGIKCFLCGAFVFCSLNCLYSVVLSEQSFVSAWKKPRLPALEARTPDTLAEVCKWMLECKKVPEPVLYILLLYYWPLIIEKEPSNCVLVYGDHISSECRYKSSHINPLQGLQDPVHFPTGKSSHTLTDLSGLHGINIPLILLDLQDSLLEWLISPASSLCLMIVEFWTKI